MTLNAQDLGFAPIDLGPDELPDGAVLLVRIHMPGDATRVVMRYVGGDWVVRRGLLDVGLEMERREPWTGDGEA